MQRIAVISEHASPLALPGGTDSGGQNVCVGHLARELSRLGYRLDIFTRREHAAQPAIVEWRSGVRSAISPGAAWPCRSPRCTGPC
ncbi:MAG: hypothetical protein NBV65_03360 [Burkholderiaceae bacterium]|nr:hypothetical protein [Burkholderiaceae bacterium]